MNSLDLRPLALGEILDRSFSLYRQHFLLFIGISAIPHLFVLAASLAQLMTNPAFSGARVDPGVNPLDLGSIGINLLLTLVVMVVSVVTYLFSQGGTIFAISEIYLGRRATIGQSLHSVLSEIWPLLGVVILSGMAIGLGMLLLLVPGVYLACRLLVCVPSTLVEKRGPGDALSRSFDLTRDHAGRAFLILVLSVVLGLSASAVFSMPFSVLMVMSAKNPEMMRLWAAMSQVGSTVATVLINPMMLIATSLFYFDLRIRKEAFDLQFLMGQDAQKAPPAASAPPSIL